jgi:energy-coupling factor transporter ATP-binding protein EcfA2
VTPALEMEAVRKVYKSSGEKVIALDHADLVVGSDEIVALVGPSGSGKTTLCSIAGGILAPTAGRVVFGGHDISGDSARELTDFRREMVGLRLPDGQPGALPHRAREPARRRRGGAPHGPQRGDGPTRCSRSSASTTAPTTSSVSCRAARSSASRSAAR